MRKSTTFALAFMTVAGATASVAAAADNNVRKGPQQSRLERADADNSGDITFEEFAAAMDNRLGAADADGDGKMTVAEIADQIQRMRAERAARRMIERFDTDGDGVLTKAEVEARQKKMFALLDRNDDGKVEAGEMQRRGEGRGWRNHRR